MKKLSKEELSEYNNARVKYFDTKLHLADIAITEENIREEKVKTMSDIRMSKSILDSITKKLVDKYGENAVINFQTGEVK